MRIFHSWGFWGKTTCSLFGVLAILSIWIVAYLFLSTLKDRNRRNIMNAASSFQTTHAIFRSKSLTYNQQLHFKIDDVIKEVEASTILQSASRAKQKININFQERFFGWQDSKSDIQPKIGPDYIINASKYFIYRCDMHTMSFCGGWGDRVRGITVAYLIANLTGRVFKIELNNPPCDMGDILVPNLVNWSLPTPFHKIVPRNTTGVISYNMVGSLTFSQDIQYMNFTQWLGTEADYVYFKGNAFGIKQFRASNVYQQQLTWMNNLRNSDIVSAIFKRLFKLSRRLNTKLKKFLAAMAPSPQHKLVCAHVRVGKNPSNPLDVDIITPENDIPGVWKFLNLQSRTDLQSVFVMSDSEAVIEEAKKQEFRHRLYVTPGTVIHVDRYSTENSFDLCTGLEKVLFDQHVLMSCDVLMVSHSGVSKIAASVREEDQGLYILKAGGKVVPVRLSSFY